MPNFLYVYASEYVEIQKEVDRLYLASITPKQ